MFVIPCKYSVVNNTIFDSINSIKMIYPDERIVVVDSCSEDKSYFSKLDVYDILEGNCNYEIGAYLKAFVKYPNEMRYFNIHDSLIVNGIMPDNELVTIQWFDNVWDDEEQFLWAKSLFDAYQIKFKWDFIGCFGSMFICSNDIMKRMIANGISNFKPISKKQSCGMERVIGIMLSSFGYDLRECAIQGKHINFTHNYDDSIVRKIFKGRI